MASHGGGGNKFVSVNLNKSFGQSGYHHSHIPHYNGSYGQAAAGRNRPGSHGGGGGGGAGDGMVVLSRPRSSQKAAPKLSVPPPLNLPSLRKEHEKFDLTGSGGGSAGGAGTGSGSRPNLSGIGWTKPTAIALQDKDESGDVLGADRVDQSIRAIDGINKGSTSYMPPSVRFTSAGVPVTASNKSYMAPTEKAMVLRGEDFPSLKAALPATSGPLQKQRDISHHKQKQGVNEESSHEQRDNYHLNSPLHMRPQEQYTFSTNSNGLNANGSQGRRFDSSHLTSQARKQEDYPLPLVRLNPRNDWADDERDTGHGIGERGREHGLTRSEGYWDRDFDMPKSSILPQKPPNKIFERQGPRDDEIGRGPSSEVHKMDPYLRDTRTPGQDGHNWRMSPFRNDGVNLQEAVSHRTASSQPTSLYRDNGRENKYIPPPFGDSARDGGYTGNGETVIGRKDAGLGQDGRQHWNHIVESGSRVSERRDRFGVEQSSRHVVETSQNRTISKSSFSTGGKGLPLNDPILNFSRDKLPLPKSDGPYLEDPLLKDFSASGYDEKDPFSVGLVGVIKRKKEVVNQADFHDPIRESFEAELERVQKMQEMERQRIIEEQERVLEQARREEEERQRLIREDEERRRRLEEEAQEAAWREEQERLEAIQRAEEQRIAREEEKRRIFIEEERRKQAAKQKLLELEARMAQRQADSRKSDSSAVANEEVSNNMKEKDVFGDADLDDWEDSERMVERITTSASSDSSALNRPFATNSRLPSFGESSSGYLERGKAVNSWRKDVVENGNSSSFALQDQDNGHQSSRTDAPVGGRAFPRKEIYGGAGYNSHITYPKGRLQDLGEYAHSKEHRWNPSANGDSLNRNRQIGAESYENFSEQYDDADWGQVHAHANPYSAYPDQLYPNSEADELYSYGRSRHSMKQPRVLPPPSIASMQKSSFRGKNELLGPSASIGIDTHYTYAARSESALQEEFYDESDVSGDSQPLPASAEEKGISLSENGSVVLNKTGKDIMITTSSSILVGEDEEWTLEKNEEMQEQEEYDEDGYQEEDEVHEVDDDNIDLTHEFENLHLEEKDSSHMMDNLVLGFDEGVEVGLPIDEFETNPRGEGNTFEIPEFSVGIVEDKGSIDGNQGDQENFQHLDCSPQKSAESAAMKMDDTVKTTQEMIIQPMNDPPTSVATDSVNNTNSSSSSGLATRYTVPSSNDMALHSSCGQPTPSAISSVQNQADFPVKLQFGLFTGPSLIPSPVPAIQIGSIQMPLHLHLPLDPSITHLQPSQPPLFQFGQLSYSSPISQGVMPMAPQPMSFVHPNIQHLYKLNQNCRGSTFTQPSLDAGIHNLRKDDVSSHVESNQPTVTSKALEVSSENRSKVLSSFSIRGSVDSDVLVHKAGTDVPHAVDNKHMSKSVFLAEDKEQDSAVNDVGLSNEEGLDGLKPSPAAMAQFISRENYSNVSKGQGPSSGSKPKKFPYSVGNYGLRSFPTHEASRADSSGSQRRPRRAVQRTEFRIRQSSGSVLSNNSSMDDKSNLNGRGVESPARSGYKRGTMTTKSFKQVAESETLSSGRTSSQEIYSKGKLVKEAFPKGRSTPISKEGSLKRNIFEEDVEAPSQSGIVRVFKQSGIEAPSDDDDFIEVRSKRQMLNDRREQREKEIKAKSRVAKPPRKPRSSAQSTIVSSSSYKVGREASNNTRTGPLVSESIMSKEVSIGFTPITSQQLAPIGTPAVNTDRQTDMRSHTKSLQTSSVPVVSAVGKEIGARQIFEAKNKALDNVQTPLGPWGDTHINQQVMALTQTQFDEAMKPARFETHVSSFGGHTTSELKLPSSINMTKDKQLSSSASPINSLLAGEKIQFGAVTSPTVLPPSTSHVASLGIGAPGDFLSDIQMLPNISKAESNCTLLFEKDNCPNESCDHLEDCEDEAEAAASAVAVAAISNDKIVGNEMRSVSISDAKGFGGVDVHGMEGVVGDQQSGTQSRVEESLSVSLPADLSVETPPISLWPPLPSPQNTSTQMLSHFPLAPPSHFPFYEMNPMLGGPIFAFSPLEESSGSQSQSQKSSVSGPGHLGTWQQCHPTMDSFYGPQAGFTGPYISPPGGIPGVQAPPQMVVYNHYARVGQFGQVGLSFMGTTYIPSGKQPDWKHNPTSSGMGSSDGERNNVNLVSAHLNPPNMPSPVQHLGPGSPLLPMGSPLAMFDVSPFQSASDMSVQGHWPHVPALPHQSVPLSLPLQQQAGGVLPSQFGHGHPVEHLKMNRFSESQTSTSESDRTFPAATDVRDTHLPNELGLVDPSSRTAAGTPPQVVNQSSGESAISKAGKSDAVQSGSSNTSNQQSINTSKPQHSQQKHLPSQQYNHPAGHAYQRGGAAQKSNSTGEWSHRRMGFHGRNHSIGAEKNFPTSKVRQIYVAKQTSGNSTTE